ncbi:MAG TPA: hypothetical protein VGP07_18470 [Polyangia bacterium]|jgi:hypothetical protein
MATDVNSAKDHSKSVGAKDVVLVVISTLAVFLLVALIVAKRSPNGEATWLSLSPDTEMYVKMVVGAKASPPFAYRRLVPFIASLIPFSPVQALGAITLGSLLAGYGILSWILVSQLQLRRVAACLALVAVMTSTRGLLIIQNPYIIDGFSFLVMTIMLAAFLRDSSGTFGAAAIIGILAREDCVFGVFGFVASAGRRRARASIVVALSAAVAYVLPRLGHGRASLGFLGLSQIVHASYYAKAYFAFGILWPMALGGLLVARGSKWNRLLPYSACAFAGSIVSTFFAVDTTRMFLPMLPLVAVGCGLVFDRLLDRPALVVAWAAILLSNVGLAVPTVFSPQAIQHMKELEEWYVLLAIPIVTQQVCGLALVAFSARAVVAQSAVPRRSQSLVDGSA